MKKIILASASPRRKELLEQIGLDFQVMVCGGEEPIETTIPEEAVKEHALQKLKAVVSHLEETDNTKDVIVLSADTVVAYGDKILEKPKDEQDARDMLALLQGNTHQVYTGVALYDYLSKEKKLFAQKTEVSFFAMTEEEIAEYVNTKEPMDKAGSYGIQGIGGKFVREIKGDYNNVVGLPVARIYQEIKWMMNND